MDNLTQLVKENSSDQSVNVIFKVNLEEKENEKDEDK